MHDIFEKVDGNVVTVREVSPHIQREEEVNLPFGTELSTEGSSGDCWSVLVSSLHLQNLLSLLLQDWCNRRYGIDKVLTNSPN